MLSPACRVPEVYLTFPSALRHTRRLIDRHHSVRVLVVGHALVPAVPTRRGRLEKELERRLPGSDFVIIDDRGAIGLAADVFGRIQSEVFDTEPDLVVWEVGASDAVAAADPASLGATIRDAAHWLRERNIDLVLVDPPFVPELAYEHIYWPIVGEIGAVSDRAGINLLRWYAVMQYWDIRNVRGEHRQALLAGKRPCMPELLAEAIARAATR
ncbi:MAG TPA: hypothetical protein VHD15_00470 [Hyphomicrobiales bacterium]|nr:hypothetical protein [Hyphomicrobiales bacterium]